MISRLNLGILLVTLSLVAYCPYAPILMSSFGTLALTVYICFNGVIKINVKKPNVWLLVVYSMTLEIPVLVVLINLEFTCIHFFCIKCSHACNKKY